MHRSISESPLLLSVPSLVFVWMLMLVMLHTGGKRTGATLSLEAFVEGVEEPKIRRVGAHRHCGSMEVRASP